MYHEASQATSQPLLSTITKNSKRSHLSMASHQESSSSTSSSSSSHHIHSSFSPMAQLNQDQIFSILYFLPHDSILSFSMTCRKFRSLASSPFLWEHICRRDWGGNSVDALLASFSFQERRSLSWIRLYKEVSHMGSLSCQRLLSKDGIFPRPRASLSLNFQSGCLVLFGGGCEGGRHLDDTWIAQVKGSQHDRVLSWKQVNSGYPSGRFGHTCTIVGNTIVLFGGINDNGIRHNDTWVGNVIPEGSSEITVSWQLLDNVGPIAPPPRGAHTACLAGDNRVLVIHGGIGLYGLRLGDTWFLDLSDGLLSARWHQIANVRPSPPARSGHSLTWIGGDKMVLFGGRGSGYEVLNDLWVFELGGDGPRWTELGDDSLSGVIEMPLPRVGHSASLILGGKILIYGGEDTQRHRKDDFWVLDIATLLKFHATSRKKGSTKGMWKRLRIEGWGPDYRSFHGACTDLSGRYVFIFGGMVDGVIQPGEASGLRFDGELFLVELVLQL